MADNNDDDILMEDDDDADDEFEEEGSNGEAAAVAEEDEGYNSEEEQRIMLTADLLRRETLRNHPSVLLQGILIEWLPSRPHQSKLEQIEFYMTETAKYVDMYYNSLPPIFKFFGYENLASVKMAIEKRVIEKLTGNMTKNIPSSLRARLSAEQLEYLRMANTLSVTNPIGFKARMTCRLAILNANKDTNNRLFKFQLHVEMNIVVGLDNAGGILKLILFKMRSDDPQEAHLRQQIFSLDRIMPAILEDRYGLSLKLARVEN
jgi:hypothetical protein